MNLAAMRVGMVLAQALASYQGGLGGAVFYPGKLRDWPLVLGLSWNGNQMARRAPAGHMAMGRRQTVTLRS
jgi:hypothetical protein